MQVLGLPLPGDEDDALLSDQPAVRRRLRHQLWLNWGDSSLDMGVSRVPFMHQDASPMASALDSLERFLHHEQKVLEDAPFQELLPTPHKVLLLFVLQADRVCPTSRAPSGRLAETSPSSCLTWYWVCLVQPLRQLLGLKTVGINRAAETKVWRRVMLKQHTDKRVPLQGETAAEAAANAAKYNDAHDLLKETRPRVACLHDYAKTLVPQVPPPTLEPKRASKLRALWTRVTRKDRQVLV